MLQLLRIGRMHWQGLSDPRNGAAGRPNRVAQVLLYGVPTLLAVVAFSQDWNMTPLAGTLLGGYALATGVLIGVFTQLASWRSRLDDRAAIRPESEAAARRSVDAAVAHCLIGVVACLFAAMSSVLVQGGAVPANLWGALAVFFGVYIFGLLLLLVQSMYIGYESSVDIHVREADAERRRGPGPTSVDADRIIKRVG